MFVHPIRSSAESGFRRNFLIYLFLVLMLPTLGGTGCNQGPPGEEMDREPPRHILLITLDALRADHLGCYGYPAPTSPAVDRLAAGGMLFSEAQVPRGQTWPSLSSLLTGQYPIQHGIRSNSVHAGPQLEMLPQFLQGAGYRTGAFLSNYGDAIQTRVSYGLDHLIRADAASLKSHDRMDDEMTRQAVSWVTENRDRSAFTWIHLMNPHRPYDPPELERDLLVGDRYHGWLDDRVTVADLTTGIRDGSIPLTEEQFDQFAHASYWRPRKARNYLELMQKQDWALSFDQLLDLIVLERVNLSPDDLAYLSSRYDAEVRAADRCVGRLLDALERLGLTDQTLVILTSDHGDELYDRNQYLFHSCSIYRGVLRVPLILSWPGRISPSTVESGLVEITDLLPTILEAAGASVPPGLPGRSLLGPPAPEPDTNRTRCAFAEVAHHLPEGTQAGPPMDAAYSVRDARWKLVLNPSGLQPRHVPYICLPDRGFPIAREELYDLQWDPGEQNNLLAMGRTKLKAMAREAGEGGDLNAAEYLLEANLAFKRLSGELTAWLKQNEPAPNAHPASPATEEVQQRLAALGYVEGKPLTPSPPAAFSGGGGRERMIRTALQLTQSPPPAGTKKSPSRTHRARNLARRARARLGEPQPIHPIVE